jgi:hypothetical protein
MFLRKWSFDVHISNFICKLQHASLVLAIGILQLAFIAACYAQEPKDLSAQNKSRLTHLKDGKEAITADDKPLFEQEARFHIHRLTQDKYWRKQAPGNLGLDDFVEDTCKLIPMPTEKKPLSDGQQQYLEVFASAYLAPIDGALRHREPIVKVNAARILARIAEAIGGSYSTLPSANGQAKVAEELLKIIKDKDQIDAVKFWALHGLEGLFTASYTSSAVPVNERPNRRALTKADLEDQIIVALVDFVLRKPNLRPNPTPEEVEGFRYVRRQAIRALAQTRFPAVMNKKEFVGTPTALALSRVLVDDGISPTASLSENLEAAIGICQLQTNLTDGYQPDYAAHAVGLFTVELGKAFNDRPQVAQGQTDNYPWKLFATRLLAALQSWREGNPTNTPSGKYITTLFEKFDTMIRTVQRKQGNVNVNDLEAWLRNPPPDNSLFKGHPETVVKPAEASSDQ